MYYQILTDELKIEDLNKALNDLKKEIEASRLKDSKSKQYDQAIIILLQGTNQKYTSLPKYICLK